MQTLGGQPTNRRGFGSRFLIAVVALAATATAAAVGCGSGGSGDADAEKFVGTWQWTTGTINATCPGVAPFMQDLSGQTLTLVKGSGSEIIATLSATCQITFSVSGMTATAKSGQMCKLMVGTTSQTVDVSSWTINSTDATSLSTDLKGTALSGLCDVAGMGTLGKQADGGA